MRVRVEVILVASLGLSNDSPTVHPSLPTFLAVTRGMSSMSTTHRGVPELESLTNMTTVFKSLVKMGVFEASTT